MAYTRRARILTIGTIAALAFLSPSTAVAQPEPSTPTSSIPSTTDSAADRTNDACESPTSPTTTVPADTTAPTTAPCTTTPAPSAAPTTTPEPQPALQQPPAAQPSAPEPPASQAPATPTTSGTKIPYTGLPTENPNSTIIPGQMRSDREEWPEPFTKEDADRAEVREAELQQLQTQQTAARAIPAPGPDCQQYWPSENWVCGAIRDKYNSLGAQFSFLLFPTSEELVNPDGFGRRQTFANGPIYWSAASGAHPVVNHFFAAWQRNGWESGVLGYPTSDEIVNPDNVGRRQEFQGGSVYWRLNEAYFVGGAIRDKWRTVGAEGGFLGYPITDEQGTPNGGRFNRFEHGAIYWSAATGAQTMSDVFFNKWASLGYESGYLGYPVAGDVLNTDNLGRHQQFQGGFIYWHPIYGAYAITGRIYDAWAAQGYENGPLNYPLSDELDTRNEFVALGQRITYFLRGGLIYNSTTDEVVTASRVNYTF